MPPTDRDPQASTEKATQAQLAEQTRIGDLTWLMGDVRGRRFMWWLLSQTGIYRSSFTGDALSMSFREGERAVGLRCMGEVTQHCPQRLSQMQTETRTNERKSKS